MRTFRCTLLTKRLPYFSQKRLGRVCYIINKIQKMIYMLHITFIVNSKVLKEITEFTISFFSVSPESINLQNFSATSPDDSIPAIFTDCTKLKKDSCPTLKSKAKDYRRKDVYSFSINLSTSED